MSRDIPGSETNVKYLVIGAGPSGLSLAYHLLGDTLVLEKESQVGGLCRSFQHQDGVFDIGGHSFHTPHAYVADLVEALMNGQLYVQPRDAQVYSSGVLIPYPFQQFFEQLPDPVIVEACREGLQHRSAQNEAHNFEEHILNKFGVGIADHFMLPYNRKLWARDLKSMSVEWTSERVAGLSKNDKPSGAPAGKRRPLQAETAVGYPTNGGFEEISRSFVAHIPSLELNCDVQVIDPLSRTLETNNGRIFQYKYLISTMPLPILLSKTKAVPAPLIDLADQLAYVSIYVEFLLAGRQLLNTPQRVYVADPEMPAHKLVFNHNSSPYLRSQPQHAIMAEVSYSKYKPVDKNSVATQAVRSLIEMGFLNSADEILWNDHVDMRFGYPVPTHNRIEIVGQIKAYLAQHEIYTLGRFGEWAYINSDECINKGKELADYLKQLDR